MDNKNANVMDSSQKLQRDKIVSGHPMRNRWYSMRNRCLNPQHPRFKYYGGRGITVQESWFADFWAYVDDIYAKIGLPPTPKHSIDRIDNNQGYNIDNVRWATQQVQTVNVGPRHDSTTGIWGLHWDSAVERWIVQISLPNGVRAHHRFKDREKAEMYLNSARVLRDFILLDDTTSQRKVA